MQNNKLEILVTAKDSASSVIQGVGKSFGHLGDSAMAGSKAAAAGLAVAGAAALAFGKTSVDAYFGAAEASAKLATNLMNVKGNTQANVKELEGLASQLQSVGVIEDDVIKAGMSQLATFNLQGSTIAKLTPKITDMVAQLKGHNATAEDMVGINNLVGKVMTGNVGALSRYGVTLSETQAEMIKNGTEAERAAMIVEVLGQNYGEVNKALRNTPQGMLTALKNDFGDLQEGVGELIVSALMPLAQAFSGWIAKVNEAGGFVDYFSKLVENNKDKVKMLAGALIAVLLPAFVSLVTTIAPVTLAIAGLMAVGALLAPQIDKLAQKFGGWGAIFERVKTWVGQLKDGIMVLWDSFKAGDNLSEAPGFFNTMAVAGERLRQVWEGLKATGVAVWNAIKLAIDFLQPSFTALVQAVQDRLLPALLRLWQFIEPAIIPTLKVLGVIIGAVIVAAIWVAINVLNVIISVLSWFINIIIEVVQRVIWFGKMVVEYVQFVYNMWSAIFNAMYAVVKFIIDAIIAYYRWWFNTIVSIIQGIPGFFASVFNHAKNLVTSIWSGITGFFGGIVNGIRNVIGGITNALTAPFEAAFNFVKGIPGRMVDAVSNVGQLLRNKLGDWDIPGPLGKVRDVIPGFATGGFTGRGGKYEVAGLVHRGEYVIPKEQVNQSTGLPYSGGGVTIEIHGGVHNHTAEAAEAFGAWLDRQAEKAGQGFAL